MWFVVGGWASLALANLLGISPEQIATNPSAAGPIAGYLVIIVPYPVFLLGSVLAVTFLHRLGPLTLVTGRRHTDWRRVGTGLGVWFVLAVLGGLVGFLLDPSAFSLGPNLAAFVPFALLAVVLTPIQTTAEEVFFRGYLGSAVHAAAPRQPGDGLGLLARGPLPLRVRRLSRLDLPQGQHAGTRHRRARRQQPVRGGRARLRGLGPGYAVALPHRSVRARLQPDPVSGGRGALLRGGLRALPEAHQGGHVVRPLLARWVSPSERSLPETSGGSRDRI